MVRSCLRLYGAGLWFRLLVREAPAKDREMKKFIVTVTWADGGDFQITEKAMNKSAAMIHGENMSRRYGRATAKIKKITAKLVEEAVK